MFLFCCFVLPNGQEKLMLMTSPFISYDGVWCFCSVVLLYHYAYLYCSVFFHPDRQYTRISLRNSLILCVRLPTFRRITPGTQSAISTSTSSNYWPTSTVWRLCQGNCVKRPQKYNSVKISLIHLYVQNREWISRLDEVIATLKDSTESLSSAIWG